MHEQSLLLQALWKRDQARDALLEERAELGRRVKRGEATREAGQVKVEAAAKALAALKEEERVHSRRMESYIKHRDRAQRAIDQDAVPDYRVALSQVEQCAAIVDEEETFLLEHFERIEAAETVLRGAENGRDAGALRAKEAMEAQAARTPGLDAALAEATRARDDARDGIFRAELARYDRLRAKGQEPFADVRDGACQGCNVGVNGTDLSEHKRAVAVIVCRHCGRFLGELL